MIIGAHVRSSLGLPNSIDHARAIGADCLQMFVTAPQTWRSPRHSDADVALFRARRQEHGFGPVLLHSIYLINLVSADPALRERSAKSLVTYLTWAHRLGAEGVITHLGSARDTGIEEAERLLPAALEQILNEAEGDALLLLESTAGPGATYGSTIAQLCGAITATGSHRRLGICLDTAHVFASGIYDGSERGLEALLAEVDRSVGLQRLGAVHLNDSKSAFGSRVDRHANVGEGQLGLAGLWPWLNHKSLAAVPFILEVPGENRAGPAAADISAARKLVGAARPDGGQAALL